MITRCPHCRTPVLPKADGTCPACRGALRLKDEPFDQRPSLAAEQGSNASVRTGNRPAPRIIRGLGTSKAQIVAMVVCCGIVGWVAIVAGQALVYIALVVFILALVSQYRSWQSSPRLEIDQNVTIVRGQQRVSTPADNVQLVELTGSLLRLHLRNPSLVSPPETETTAGALETSADRFHAHHISELRQALGLTSVVADKQALQKQDFIRILHRLTPRVFLCNVLLAANVLIFAIMVLRGVHVMRPTPAQLLEWGANQATWTLTGEPWRLITSAFLHFGVVHLLGNAWGIWLIGRIVERLLGNTGFVVVYLVAAVSGSLVSLIWSPGPVSAGASGGVFGLMGGLAAFVVRRKRDIPDEMLKSLFRMVLTLVVLNVGIGFMVPNIDNAAHLGGLAGGFLSGLVLCRPLTEESITRRVGRYTAVASAAAIILFCVYQSIPREVHFLLRDIYKAEKTSRTADGELWKRRTAGEGTNEELADEWQRRCATPWAKIDERLQKLENVPRAYQRQIERHRELARLMAEYFRLRTEGVRESNQAKILRANSLVGEINKLLASE